MKLFPQLALVSAIAISGNAMAMQALDDDSLSAATGQDGITIAIKPPVSMFDAAATGGPFAASGGMAGIIAIDSIYVHDRDGLAGTAGTATAGAIVLDGFKIAGSSAIIVDIDSDAGDSAKGGALLNIKVGLPQTLVLRTGDISVAGSNRTTAAGVTDITTRGIDTGNKNKILDSIDISLGGASLNIQLGGEKQGAMIKASGTIANGLTITGINLKDTTGIVAAAAVPGTSAQVLGTKGGSIYLGSVNIRDTTFTPGSPLLTLAADIDASPNGLIVTMGGAKTDILLADVRLGNVAATPALGNLDTTKSIGDVEIVGMNMVGTQIAISGH